MFEGEWRDEFEEIIDVVSWFSEYYTRSRYPFMAKGRVFSPDEYLDKEVASEAIDKAKKVIDIAGDYLKGRGLFSLIKSVAKEILGDRLLAIIIFGSTIYLGRGRDIDLVIVVGGDLEVKGKLDLEYKVRSSLFTKLREYSIDANIMSLKDFEDNLKPGTFLSGLALGYEILLDEAKIEDKILKFLKELSKTRYILHNKYGSWNLGFHAKITYNLKSKRG